MAQNKPTHTTKISLDNVPTVGDLHMQSSLQSLSSVASSDDEDDDNISEISDSSEIVDEIDVGYVMPTPMGKPTGGGEIYLGDVATMRNDDIHDNEIEMQTRGR